jgi:hypothetical protein
MEEEMDQSVIVEIGRLWVENYGTLAQWRKQAADLEKSIEDAIKEENDLDDVDDSYLEQENRN